MISKLPGLIFNKEKSWVQIKTVCISFYMFIALFQKLAHIYEVEQKIEWSIVTSKCVLLEDDKGPQLNRGN